MKLYIIITSLAILISLNIPVNAHDNWIDAEKKGTSKAGSRLNILIGNGHHFPESNLLLKKRIIQYVTAITPDSKRVSIETFEQGKFRKGVLDIKHEGTYIIIAALKNPPRYYLKSIITTGRKPGRLNLRVDEFFEIVPEKLPAAMKMGNTLPLVVLYNGRPVQTDLSFSINGKYHFSTFTDRKGKYALRIKTRGKYLATSSFKGKQCSLVFSIP